MRCPNCKIEMEKGTLYAHGSAWTQKPIKQLLTGIFVAAYKCPSCGKIELQSESSEKEAK